MIFPSNQPGAGYHSNAGMNGFHQPFINRTGGLPMQPTPHLPLHLPPQQPQPQHPNLPPPHPGSYHYESDRRAQSISLTSINDFLDPGSPKRKNYRPGLMEQLTLKEDEGQVVPGDSGLEEKAVQRKHYHPAAPANRSEWVMWVGNVPNNATHEEMWKFFHQTIPLEAIPPSIPHKERIEVASIFLISRSSCAFVNLYTQEELLLAITWFNGKSLRPQDPRCPKMVCRVRKMDDDLKAGVGGQRGAGIHTKYVQELMAKEKAEALAKEVNTGSSDPDEACKNDPTSNGPEEPSSPTPMEPPSPAVFEDPPEGQGRRRSSVVNPSGITPAVFAAWQHDRSQSGTHSFASTNSSFLVRNFPKRYFILKSLTQEELDNSVKYGTWSTQLHNEAILDQAFRTSPEVYLIFGANKQGSFFGYASMKSGIASVAEARRKSGISFASRSPNPAVSLSSLSNPSVDKSSGSTSKSSDDPKITKSGRPRIPHAGSETFRMTTQSPGELSPSEELSFSSMGLAGKGASASCPAGAPAGEKESEPKSRTLDPTALAKIREEKQGFELDAHAPARAAEKRKSSQDSQPPQDTGDTTDDMGVARHDMATPVPEAVAQVDEASGPSAENQAKIGSEFQIEWVKIGTLPFHRLRHLRNPWNQDKEVKVSRDGTELEPTVGALLLSEWEKLESGAPNSHKLPSKR